jgi:hypothetical protein
LDAYGGGQKIGDRAPMAEHASHSLDGAEAKQDGRPRPQAPSVAADGGIYRLAQCGGDQTLGTHPDGTEEAAADDGGELLARQPEEEAHRRAGVGFTGIREWESSKQSRPV